MEDGRGVAPGKPLFPPRVNVFLFLPPLLSSLPEHQPDWEMQQPGIQPDNYH